MSIKKEFNVEGMTCNACEKVITKTLEKLPGVHGVSVSYETSKLTVKYDETKVTKNQITSALESKNYFIQDSKHIEASKNKRQFALGWAFAILGLVVIGYVLFQFSNTINVPEISQNMGYGLLFVVGLLTGFHCVGMCGGFMVSYISKGIEKGHAPAKLHASYGVAKTISYTIIGAVFGLIGSIVAFTPAMKGAAAILAGIFLIVFGLKMLNIFPKLRKFQIRFPSVIEKQRQKWSHKYSGSPIAIGLLNGLMIACGPLQAIYVMAAGTGSMVEGAKMLFIFGLGTLPVMLSFGYITSIVGSKFTRKIVKYSGVVVIILGIIMFNRGLALAGTGYDFNSLQTTITGSATSTENSEFNIVDGYQIIEMDVTRYGWEPNQFTLLEDVPVKWEINVIELTGCNRAIQVPEYNLAFDLVEGKQTIEFTPTETGTVSWSCWMGMIPGAFSVVADESEATTVSGAVQVASGSSCSAGGTGGCGCGGGV